MHVNKKILAETAGWYGISAIVLAYVLVSFGAVEGDSLAYQLLNLSGAIGVVIISKAKKIGQTLVLNLFWAGIAVFAIASVILR